MNWITRWKKIGIKVKQIFKKQTKGPEDSDWKNCPQCKKISYLPDLVASSYICECSFHFDLPPKIVKRSITDFPKGITDSPFSSIFLVSILLGSLTVFFEIDDNEIPWVEFYITSEDGNVDTIPRNWSSPEPIELVLEIVNHGVTEELTVSKTVELLNSDIISRENLTVSQSDFQDGRVTIIDSLNFSHQGEYKVQYNLTKSGEKTTFRSLQLLINYTG